MMVRLLLVATLLLIAGALRAETPAEKTEFPSKLVIYLAKGPANSCGQGCDRWIAVEGQVDEGAGARVRRFLAGVKDTQRPIYFHSLGGAVDQSYVIGRLLRSRKAIARVGRTIVTACAAGTQVDNACLKIKNAGGEVEAELTTRKAICASARGYLFLGATTREVAPDAVLAVHDSRLTLTIRGDPPPRVVADFRRRRVEAADQQRAAFVSAMGIKRELTDLIKTVKFESLHGLTRPELYRFGIDTRAQPETLWTLEKVARPYARKVVFARQGDGASFRVMAWHLVCENKNRARLLFSRESDADATSKSTIVMMAEPGKSVAFGTDPTRDGKFDVWSATVAPDIINAMLATPRLLMGVSTPATDGQSSTSTFDIDTTGLEAAWSQMLATCPATPVAAKPETPPAVPAARSPTVDGYPRR